MANKTYNDLANDLQLFANGSYNKSDLTVLDHVLYDTTQFAASSVRPSTQFFSTPQGAPYGTGTKSLVETNMQLQGQIPNSQYFIVKEISVALISAIVGTDIDNNTIVSAFTNIVQLSNFKLILAGRSFDLEFPGSVMFPPVFAHGLNSAANGGNVGYHTASGWMSIKLPVVIEGGAAFSVTQVTGSAITAVQTILNTASDVLATQNAQAQVRLRGTLLRYQ